MPEGSECPILFLFWRSGVVFGGGDYVLGGRVHDVFVVVVKLVVGLRYVFYIFKEFGDLYGKLWVVGDPGGNGGERRSIFGFGL